MTDPERGSGETRSGEDVTALVMRALRESYAETSNDLREYADKIRELNERKKAVREYLRALRGSRVSALSSARERGVDLCDPDRDGILSEDFEKHTRHHDVGTVEYELCIPDRVPPVRIATLDQLEAEIANWEEKLDSVGDDAQLANVDLQSILQKQQQTLQMMSNISKMMHDTARAVIRKMGG